MKPPVHILATIRTMELLDATLLVFRTVRTGFPTSEIIVHLNQNNTEEANGLIVEAANKVGCSFSGVRHQIHHTYIHHLLSTVTEPHIILDCDMVFHENVENFDYTDCHLRGMLIPQFQCAFVKAITRPRLHGSFLYFDPERIRLCLEAFHSRITQNQFTPLADLINPLLLPLNGRMVFWDVCALLYEAIGGTPFTDAQLDCYSHLHNGTISDMVAPCYPEIEMRSAHFAIFENPKLSRGVWREQMEFYAKRKVEL